MSSRVRTFTSHVSGDDGDKVDVTVTAEISGKHVPVKMYGDDAHPEEWPDVDITSILDDNGVDITDTVSSYEMDRLIEEALEGEDEDEPEYEHEDQDD